MISLGVWILKSCPLLLRLRGKGCLLKVVNVWDIGVISHRLVKIWWSSEMSGLGCCEGSEYAPTINPHFLLPTNNKYPNGNITFLLGYNRRLLWLTKDSCTPAFQSLRHTNFDWKGKLFNPDLQRRTNRDRNTPGLLLPALIWLFVGSCFSSSASHMSFYGPERQLLLKRLYSKVTVWDIRRSVRTTEDKDHMYLKIWIFLWNLN